MKPTYVELMRHGEPVGGPKFRGRLDEPLSDLGWQQMRDAVSEDESWDVILTSPLSRCSAFAHELADKKTLPIAVEPEFVELSFGDWEGLKPSEPPLLDDPKVLGFWEDPLANSPPGGECLYDFQRRISSAWQRLLVEHEGKKVLLVAHGGVIRIIVSQVLQSPLSAIFRLDVPYASRSLIEVYQGQEEVFPRLLYHAR